MGYSAYHLFKVGSRFQARVKEEEPFFNFCERPDESFKLCLCQWKNPLMATTPWWQFHPFDFQSYSVIYFCFSMFIDYLLFSVPHWFSVQCCSLPWLFLVQCLIDSVFTVLVQCFIVSVFRLLIHCLSVSILMAKYWFSDSVFTLLVRCVIVLVVKILIQCCSVSDIRVQTFLFSGQYVFTNWHTEALFLMPPFDETNVLIQCIRLFLFQNQCN